MLDIVLLKDIMLVTVNSKEKSFVIFISFDSFICSKSVDQKRDNEKLFLISKPFHSVWK